MKHMFLTCLLFLAACEHTPPEVKQCMELDIPRHICEQWYEEEVAK